MFQDDRKVQIFSVIPLDATELAVYIPPCQCLFELWNEV